MLIFKIRRIILIQLISQQSTHISQANNIFEYYFKFWLTSLMAWKMTLIKLNSNFGQFPITTDDRLPKRPSFKFFFFFDHFVALWIFSVYFFLFQTCTFVFRDWDTITKVTKTTKRESFRMYGRWNNSWSKSNVCESEHDRKLFESRIRYDHRHFSTLWYINEKSSSNFRYHFLHVYL